MVNIDRFTFDEFVNIGVKAIVAKNVPAIFEIPNDIKGNLTLDKINEKLQFTEINLLQRPKINNASKHISVSKMEYHSLFENKQHHDPDNNTECFVVSNLKNEPEIIKNILGFNYQGLFKNLTAVNLWLNYMNSFSSPHFDDLENFNVQLVGAKRFVLYKPGIKNYYISSLLKGTGHASRIPNFEQANLDEYPNFKNVIDQKIEVILKSGEMLYLPFAWWHQVYSLDSINININFWFLNYKILLNPYILFDSIYKNIFRNIKGIYNVSAPPTTLYN